NSRMAWDLSSCPPNNKTMGRRILRFSLLPVLGAFLFFGFSTKDHAPKFEILTSNLPETYTVSLEDNFSVGNRDFHKLGNGYLAFKEAVAFMESRGDYRVINLFGYMAKYQFGKGTLSMIGTYD